MKEAIIQYTKRLDKQIKIFNSFLLVNHECHRFYQAISKKFETKIIGKQFIYIIRTDFTDAKQIIKDFTIFKNNPKTKEDFRLSSVNNPVDFKGVLYVGSSSTSLKTRINQHLGNQGPKVFSLQLKHWFKTEVKRDPAKITIEIIPIDEKYVEILYPLENALWDYHKPLFGKKGPNVKSSSRI